MREGITKGLAWRASRGNVAVWIPDDVILMGSGRTVTASITKGPTARLGSLLLFPVEQPATSVVIQMGTIGHGPLQELTAAARHAQNARQISEDDWTLIVNHAANRGLRNEMSNARTMAQALIAIKPAALPGEQAGDNALRAALGASGGHPQLRLRDEQQLEEEHLGQVRDAITEILEAAEPERFKDLIKARKQLLPPDQITIASYWGDELDWLANDRIREFVLQFPALSTSLFGACLLGDDRAQAFADQIRSGESTRKVAAAWLQTPPGSGSPVGARVPPNWWNGTPVVPMSNPTASQRHILPALQRISQVLAENPHRSGQALKRLADCDDFAARAMPHLVMVTDKPENLKTVQALLTAGMVSGSRFSQLTRELKSLSPAHHKQIHESDFIGRWDTQRDRLLKRLGHLMAWRLTAADPHQRPKALCRGLSLDDPTGRGDVVHLADRVSRKLEERLHQIPLAQKLKMLSGQLEFNGNMGGNGLQAQQEQLAIFAVASSQPNTLLTGENVPDRWSAMLNSDGRANLTKDLEGLGTATELISAAQLSEEGERVRHCVGGYASDCRSGRASIWHLQAPDSKTGSTLEIDVVSGRGGASFKIAQHRGRRNDPPTAGEKRLAHTLLASLRQTVANETKHRDEMTVHRAERKISMDMSVALPEPAANQLRIVSQADWVKEDPECAGFMCMEPALRLGIPLPVKRLTCDLQRRQSIATHMERAIGRSNSVQAVRASCDRWGLDDLFKQHVVNFQDQRICMETFFEQFRPWLPKAMNGPDLLGACWNIGGLPEEHQDKDAKTLHAESVDRGRAWREEKTDRLAFLGRANDPEPAAEPARAEGAEGEPAEEVAAEAPANGPGAPRRRRRRPNLRDRLAAQALGIAPPNANANPPPAPAEPAPPEPHPEPAPPEPAAGP